MPPGHPRFSLRVLGAKAAASAATGRFGDALEAMGEAIAYVPEEGVEQRIMLETACAQLEELLGNHQVAHSRLVTLLEELEGHSSIHAIEVKMHLANDSFLRNDFTEMDLWSARALEDAHEHPDPEYLAVAQATRALCTAFAGPLSEARECVDAAAAAYDTFDESQLAMNVDGLVRLAEAELYLERFEDVIRHGTQAIEAARRTGQSRHFPALYPAVGTAASNMGRFDLARETMDAAIDAARLSRNDHALGWSLFTRAMVSLLQGDIDEADRLSAESMEVVGKLESGVVKVWCGVIRAATLEARGRREEALALLTGSAGGEALDLIPGSWRTGFLLLEMELLLGLDRREDAVRIYELAEARAAAFDNPLAVAHARRARASMSLAQGDPELAMRMARESLARAEEAGAPLEAGAARMVLAGATAATGDRDAAIPELETALESFSELGAERGRKMCEQLLRAMGKSIYRRSGSGSGETGIGSLTRREREVAGLVVDRQTNREIAETLFLSQKTVETHLRNIFAKLGVSSRVEVARMLERQPA